jgi:hypothetical protein
LFSSSSEQNELILVGVLDVLYDTVAALLRGQVDKKTMLDNLELVLLTIDEAVRVVLALVQSPSCHPSPTCLSCPSQIDHGHIMELDSASVVSRVLMKASETASVSVFSVCVLRRCLHECWSSHLLVVINTLPCSTRNRADKPSGTSASRRH